MSTDDLMLSDPTPLDAATVLEEAADLLLIHGRCTGLGHSPRTGEFCVRGAIAEVVQPGWFDQGANSYWHLSDEGRGRAATEALTSAIPAKFYDVSTWSDFTEDDFEVIDTLRHVAKDIRNESS